MTMRTAASTAANEQGLTLFELLVAVLLLGIISTMIYSVLDVSLRFAGKGEAKVQELDREQGFLELFGRQVDSAWYDMRQRRLRIAQQQDVLQLYTRFPLLHREAGLVLAIYRYDDATRTLYYAEKRDFYNAEYAPPFAPPIGEMVVLARFTRPLRLAYDPATTLVTVELGEARYEFLPRCHPSEATPEAIL